MKLHISRVQEFRDGANAPSSFEVQGTILSGFGVPAIGDYELTAAAKGEVHRREDNAPSSSPAASKSSPAITAGAGNVTPPRFLGKDGAPRTITPKTTKQTGAGTKQRVVVGYEAANGKMAFMACWDRNLFEAVKATLGKSTTFLTETKGEWTNIVGVKR